MHNFPCSLCKIQDKIAKGMGVLEYFATHQWNFDDTAIKTIRAKLNNLERKKYKIDAEGIDGEKYFGDCIIGARRYIVKQSDDRLPQARIMMRRFVKLYCLTVTDFYRFQDVLGWSSLQNNNLWIDLLLVSVAAPIHSDGSLHEILISPISVSRTILIKTGKVCEFHANFVYLAQTRDEWIGNQCEVKSVEKYNVTGRYGVKNNYLICNLCPSNFSFVFFCNFSF